MILRGKTEFDQGWLAGFFGVLQPLNVTRPVFDKGYQEGEAQDPEDFSPVLGQRSKTVLAGLPDEAEMRAFFEERLFNQMFIPSVQKVGTGCMTFKPVGCPPMAEAMARREDGLYVDDSVNAAWWAWQAALEWAQRQ